MLGHARCVATNVSEFGLRKEKDDVPPRKGDVIGNGTVLAWHGTLEKLTRNKERPVMKQPSQWLAGEKI